MHEIRVSQGGGIYFVFHVIVIVIAIVVVLLQCLSSNFGKKRDTNSVPQIAFEMHEFMG